MSPMVDPNGNPLRQVTQQDVILHDWRQLYFALVPIMAAKLLEKDTMDDPYLEKKEDAPFGVRVAKGAEEIALAAFSNIGITIQMNVKNPLAAES